MVKDKTKEDITLPEVWGPHAWYLIHHITRKIVNEKTSDGEWENAIINFLSLLWVFIPCAICRNHYMEYVKKDPYINYIKNAKDLDNWGFELHNKVNKMLGKKLISYDLYQKKYSKKPVSTDLKRFVDIVMELHLTPDMSISEIQDLKLFIKSILILYPITIPEKSKKTALGKLTRVYDYHTLKSFYHVHHNLL